MGVLETGSSLDTDAEHLPGKKGGFSSLAGGSRFGAISLPLFQGHFQPISHSVLSGLIIG